MNLSIERSNQFNNISVWLRDPQYLLHKYKIFLRKEEYYLNNPTKLHTIKMLYYIRKKCNWQ